MNPLCCTRAKVIHAQHTRGPACPFPPKAVSSTPSVHLLALYRDTTAHSGGIRWCLLLSVPHGANTLKRGGAG